MIQMRVRKRIAPTRSPTASGWGRIGRGNIIWIISHRSTEANNGGGEIPAELSGSSVITPLG